VGSAQPRRLGALGEEIMKNKTTDYAGWCIHFRGIQRKTCTADVDWRALTGGDDFGIATRSPCIKDNNSTVVCALCHYPTPDEVAAHEAEMEAHLARLAEDMALIGAAHTEEHTSLVYVCQLCERTARMVTTTPAEMITHASEAHGVDETMIKSAKGKMTAHMDARDWFQTDHAFSLPDGREFLLRSTRIRRRGADRAAWEDSVPRGKKRARR
jgi:hypothetical protein